MDAPVALEGEPGWLLKHLGREFVGLYFAAAGEVVGVDVTGLNEGAIPIRTVVVKPAGDQDATALEDINGLAHRHYDATPGSYYLIRPDQHVAGRWRQFDHDKVMHALARATGATH